MESEQQFIIPRHFENPLILLDKESVINKVKLLRKEERSESVGQPYTKRQNKGGGLKIELLC